MFLTIIIAIPRLDANSLNDARIVSGEVGANDLTDTFITVTAKPTTGQISNLTKVRYNRPAAHRFKSQVALQCHQRGVWVTAPMFIYSTNCNLVLEYSATAINNRYNNMQFEEDIIDFLSNFVVDFSHC